MNRKAGGHVSPGGWALTLLLLTGPESLARSVPAMIGLPTDAASPTLRVGEPVRRDLSAGETHSYAMSVQAGHYLHVTVEQYGIDLIATLVGPDGRTHLEIDNPNSTQVPEFVSGIAERSGLYHLSVRAARPEAAGPYGLLLDEHRPATPADTPRLAAQKAFFEGEQLRDEGTADPHRRAIVKYETALSLWKEAGDLPGEGEALASLGEIYALLGENEKSLETLSRALPILRTAGTLRGQARVLTSLGEVYTGLGEAGKALDSYSQALPLWRKTGYLYGLAQTLNDTGVTHDRLVEKAKALAHYREALPLWKALGEREGEALTLTSIGKVEHDLGELQRALDAYLEALSLIRAAGDKRGESVVLNNIGLVYDWLGERDKALRYFLESLPLRKEVGDPVGEAATLTAIAKVYTDIGEKEKALDHSARALTLSRSAKDRRGESIALTRLGWLHESLGEMQKALDYHGQALEIRRALGDRTGAARNLTRMGILQVALGDTEKAWAHYQEALPLNQAGNEPMFEAEILLRMAEVQRGRGRVAETRGLLEDAIRIIESLRTKLGSPDLRASYLASVIKTFELYTDVLMELHRNNPSNGFEALALAASERARSRSLLELLSEARVDIREGVDPQLRERERQLKQLLTARTERRMRLLNAKGTEAQLADSQKEIQGLIGDYEQVQAQIRSTSPRYAALTQPQPLTVPEIQRELDSDSLLLEYSLGDDRSFLWAVTSTSLTSHELPKRSEIESAARRVYELLTSRNQRTSTESRAARQARFGRADGEFAQAASTLSRMLLLPVAPQLPGKRLLIVADEALQYVPFGALPTPSSSGAAPSLVVEHELVSLPSASILGVLRKEHAARRPARGTIAVIADPVFGGDDERVAGFRRAKSVPSVRKEPDRELLRSAIEMGVADADGLRIPRLPFTRLEAEAILSLAPTKSRKAALDFDASRETATSPELADYRFVHFATHGFLNSSHPDLSGIVLSLVDRKGGEVPGFLATRDVFNLRLPVEMVVLSGCQTALGKEIRGEGLVGLTRGFLYAGAAQVVASLWKVEDAATAELMTRFYRGILGEERLRPAAALRAAQISMRKEKRWSSPYFWSAFLIQGDPR